jgi:hypothetical protein
MAMEWGTGEYGYLTLNGLDNTEQPNIEVNELHVDGERETFG